MTQQGLQDQRTPATPRADTFRTSSGWTTAISALVLLAGVVDLVSAATRADHTRLLVLRRFVPGGLSDTSSALTIVTGVLLVLLARALRRRKRRAWRLAVAVLLASVVLHLLKGLDVEEAAGSAALLVLVLLRRREFYAVGDPRTRWRGLAALLVLLVGSTALGVALIYVRRDGLVSPLGLGAALSTTLHGLVGLDGPLRWSATRAGRADADFLSDAFLSLGIGTLVCTIYLVLRPSEPPALLAAGDESRVRDLLERHGRRDSLGYFALRRDKSVIWSPSGKACVSYRVLSGVMLASGDPVGDPEAWPGAIDAFLREAYVHAWTPAVLGCGEQAGQAWSRAGLSALELGDEAVVPTAGFSLQGREMRNVRQAVARVQRAGYQVDVRRVEDIPAAERQELRAQAALWRGAATERGFSMALSRLGEDDDGKCLVVMALHDGRLRAFLHFVPWGADGLSLDLMRRDRDAVNGINEFLISALLDRAPALGVSRVSLNFAVFRSTFDRGERLGAGPVLKLTRRLLLLGSRWWQLESLYRFNEKFQPAWQPRFVCYPQARDLPRVVLAAAEAEAFLTWPTLRRLLDRGQRSGRSTEPPEG